MKNIKHIVYVLTSSLIGYFLGLLIQKQEQLPTEAQTIKQSTSVSICDEVVAQVNTKVEDIYTEEIASVKFGSFPDARNHKIILIDGNKLVSLMIKFNIGVQIKNTYELKEVDEDFFEIG